jgi:hypothetical protein
LRKLILGHFELGTSGSSKLANSHLAVRCTLSILVAIGATPGQPSWLDDIDAAVTLRPDSWKGYTIGDNTHRETSRHPWRMDDEKVAYKGYEKFLKADIKSVCVHKKLFTPSVEKSVPNLRGYVHVSDVEQAQSTRRPGVNRQTSVMDM